MSHHASTFFFRMFPGLGIVAPVKRIPLTFKTESVLKYELVKQRADQLKRSVSDYVQLVLHVHFGMAPEALLIPPDGKLDGLTSEQQRVLKAAADVLKRAGQASSASQEVGRLEVGIRQRNVGKESPPLEAPETKPQDPHKSQPASRGKKRASK